MRNITRRRFVLSAGGTTLASLLSAPMGQSADVSPRDNGSDAHDVAWLHDVQVRPRTIPQDVPHLPPLLRDEKGLSIATLAGWQRRRDQIRQRWSRFLGVLPMPAAAPRLSVLHEDRSEGCVRQLVRYESEPGEPVEGYLLKPLSGDAPRPGVVVLHSTVKQNIRQPAGIEGRPEKAFGLHLAQRGMVAFCPRCFLWQGPGSYRAHAEAFQKRHPGSKGMAKMLFDARRAVDILQSLPEVNSKQIGAVGHSLGGKETLYLAAFDPRVRVTVSSEGGIGTGYSNWDAPWYLGPSIRDGRFRHEHHELLALIAPRPFLLLGGDAADGTRSWPFIEAVVPVYRLYGSPARIGLFNHHQGHSVPPVAEQRLYDWLFTYLSRA